MIVKSARLVIPFEGEGEDKESTLMLGDLRRFLKECEGADDGVSVRVEQRLSDGFLSDVFEAEWEQR